MTEKKRDRKGTLLRLFPYLLAKKWNLLFICLLTILTNYLALLIPKYSGQAIDAIGISTQVNFTLVYEYCWKMVFCILGSVLLSYLTQVLLIRISASITETMRQEVFDHLLKLPVGFFDKNQVGDIISRISYDIDTINTSLSSDVITLLTTIITVIGSLIMMLRIAPSLCLIFVFTTPMMIYITRHRAIKVRPLFSKRSRLLGELNGFVEEMLSGQKTIKAYGQEDTMIDRFDKRNLEAVDAYYEAEYEGSIVGPTVAWINNLSLALVSGFGAILFLLGHITIGSISSFILYSRKFSGPISETANIYAELQSALSAAERVFHLLDEKTEIVDKPDAFALENVQGKIDFEDVYFSYLPGIEVLHGINIHANPGKMIAIVGPTGAGKSTIINLLMRFYDPDSGRICIDDNSLVDVTRDSLRKQFSMVLQDTWLFHGTIYENVAYGNENATKEDVIQACKAAHIHNFITSLEEGYNTILSDDGVNISKGQKQLLTIARAMLAKSKMLILDEATSNVDSYTEKEIQLAIRNLCKDKTTFVIAHRLSTIKEADLIIVLQHGRIIEQGTHEELLQNKQFYASLFNAQWEN